MAKKILIADDSAFMRQLLVKILNDGGYTSTSEAENGTEVMTKWDLEKPALTLLDIIMGDPDGVQVLKDIKAKDSAAKVMMVTAVGQETIMKEATDAGADGYITKPFKDTQIIAEVKKILGDATAEAPATEAAEKPAAPKKKPASKAK